MAIQHRRGKYADFDPSKLLPGEIAVVLSGDPASNTGRSIYICFEAGVVKRFATYEDFETEIQNATEEIQATFTEEIRNAANAAITATEAANKAVESAQAATEAANKAAEAAGAYVLGDLSNNVVTFDMASEKALPASGENMATLFGKVTKYLSDLVSGAISNVIGVNLVANRALVSDANGKIGAAEVTATELGYLSGVTSKVQTQFDELNTKNTTQDLTSSVVLNSKDDRIGSVEFQAKRYGNVITLFVLLKNLDFSSSNLASAGNIDMNISGIPLPTKFLTSCTYFSSEIFATRFQSDGVIRVRNNSSAKTGTISELAFNFEYIV